MTGSLLRKKLGSRSGRTVAHDVIVPRLPASIMCGPCVWAGLGRARILVGVHLREADGLSDLKLVEMVF